MARALSLAALLLACLFTPANAGLRAEGTDLRVTVMDSSGRAVPGAVVTIRSGRQVLAKVETDTTGAAHIQAPEGEGLEVFAVKAGFDDASEKLGAGEEPIQLTLAPAASH